MKKKKMLVLLMTAILVMGSLAGCGGASGSKEKGGTTSENSTADSSDTEENSNTNQESKLTLLVDTNTSLAGIQAVCDLAEKEIGITVTVETRPGGEDGDNLVKTRLASGDMADLCVYNSGALLNALNPSDYFIDLSQYPEICDRLDDTFAKTVTVNNATFGIPMSSSQAGGVLYNKEIYKKYNLSIPTTWDEFISNCKVLQEAGETALIGSFKDSWTAQVPFLADNYNVLSIEPDFAKNLEAGTAKYETTPAALRSWEKLADTAQFYNEDYLATSYDDASDMLINGDGAQWIMLTMALSNMYELYGDEVNNIGIFPIPGDNAESNGLTVWMPSAIYGNKNTDNTEAIIQFMEFYVSDEALDAYTGAILPDGPYCIKGYELPDNAYQAVSQDMQPYFDSGKTQVALEYLTSVKGSNCAAISQECGSGQTSALEAAKAYDADCYKQAIQLGLDWKE